VQVAVLAATCFAVVTSNGFGLRTGVAIFELYRLGNDIDTAQPELRRRTQQMPIVRVNFEATVQACRRQMNGVSGSEINFGSKPKERQFDSVLYGSIQGNPAPNPRVLVLLQSLPYGFKLRSG
jgi:hypothetical protein